MRLPPLRRATLVLTLGLCGCDGSMRATDRDVAAAIARRQREALSYRAGSDLGGRDALHVEAPGAEARRTAPSPTTVTPPTDFVAAAPESQPASVAAQSQPTTRYRDSLFTLRDAIRYSERFRREFQTAKEDLYLVTLAVLLERHLWTPQLAAEFRTVYGNYGEIRNFDQAMRFVSDLSLSQRLPFGGELTAGMVSTLVRDIRKGLTAEEGGQVNLGLQLPLLRGAGAMVAQEEVLQAERAVTYAVREFERFRRRQYVDIAGAYFDLLRAKQAVIDAEVSLTNAVEDLERAEALQSLPEGNILDTRRAQQRKLTEENRVESLREGFRAQADRFKLTIGMPVDEGLGIDDLESIGGIEQRIEWGEFPLLTVPAAAASEVRALEVATERRLDLLNRRDQIDDARRGVAISRNALLPDLGWNTTGAFDTDPQHSNVLHYEFARATWRSELVLSLPIERFRERNQLRAAIIDVRRAERAYHDLHERIRAEVRSAINQIALQARVVAIQLENVEVARNRSEYAGIRFVQGELSNRDRVEAEQELTDAQNSLNQAKTSRWSAILEFRATTETLLLETDDAPPIE